MPDIPPRISGERKFEDDHSHDDYRDDQDQLHVAPTYSARKQQRLSTPTNPRVKQEYNDSTLDRPKTRWRPRDYQALGGLNLKRAKKAVPRRLEKLCIWCQETGHLHRDCQIPGDDGFLPGCPKCETLSHAYDVCPKRKPDKDDRYYLSEVRHEKCPLRSRIDPMTVRNFWADKFRPHTPAFAKYLLSENYYHGATYGATRSDDQRIRDPAWDHPELIGAIGALSAPHCTPTRRPATPSAPWNPWTSRPTAPVSAPSMNAYSIQSDGIPDTSPHASTNHRGPVETHRASLVPDLPTPIPRQIGATNASMKLTLEEIRSRRAELDAAERETLAAMAMGRGDGGSRGGGHGSSRGGSSAGR